MTHKNATTMLIPVDLIDPNPNQPRKNFDPDKLKELAESIKSDGLIQPIVVEIDAAGERYILHDGERRVRAARLAVMTELPAYILEPGTDPTDLLIRATVANVQREDLSPIELANAYEEMKDLGMSDSQIAARVGKSRASVANCRRLLQLPEQVQSQVAAGELSESQATSLVRLYQFPPEITERVLNYYLGSKLENPTNLNRNQIRQAITDSLRGIGEEFDTFDPAEEMTIEGVRQPACTGCEYLIQSGNAELCGDRNCFKLKEAVWLRGILQTASEATGISYLDPAEEFDDNQYSRFYSNDKAIDHALSTPCENLRLVASDTPTSWYPHPNVENGEYLRFYCQHPGKTERSCTCRQAVTQDKRDEEKELKKGVKQIKADLSAHLTAIIAERPADILKGLLLIRAGYNERDKITALTEPEAIYQQVIKTILSDGVSDYFFPDLATYRTRVEEWLQKAGLPPLLAETDPLAETLRDVGRPTES